VHFLINRKANVSIILQPMKQNSFKFAAYILAKPDWEHNTRANLNTSKDMIIDLKEPVNPTHSHDSHAAILSPMASNDTCPMKSLTSTQLPFSLELRTELAAAPRTLFALEPKVEQSPLMLERNSHPTQVISRLPE
jgi:hypothetical protein